MNNLGTTIRVGNLQGGHKGNWRDKTSSSTKETKHPNMSMGTNMYGGNKKWDGENNGNIQEMAHFLGRR